MEFDIKTLDTLESTLPKTHDIETINNIVAQFKLLWEQATQQIKKEGAIKPSKEYLLKLKALNPKIKKVYDAITNASKVSTIDKSNLSDDLSVIPLNDEYSNTTEDMAEGSPFKTLSWKILNTYFKSNPDYLVTHHLDSFNQFMEHGIKKIFIESNPLKYIETSEVSSKTKSLPNSILLYHGGKNGDRITFGKPILFINDSVQYLYPNDARLHNTTYGITIHYDVEIETITYSPDSDVPNIETTIIPDIYLGMFPIMVNSNLCITSGMSPDVRFTMGECKYDHGGYFIIDGMEKVIIPEETFADNMIYVGHTPKDKYSYIAEVRSVSEDSSKPKRKVTVMLGAVGGAKDINKTNDKEKSKDALEETSKDIIGGTILVNLPNVRSPMPLFIVMRALGIISDKDIIQTCLLDTKRYSRYVELFYPSVYSSRFIDTQLEAIQYIATFVKNKSTTVVLNILTNYFLPHIGDTNFTDKAYYIGHMVKKLLSAYLRDEVLTDRDNFIFKRIHLSGNMLYDLFSEFYIIQKKKILQAIDKMYNKDPEKYHNSFGSLMEYGALFYDERIVETGFKKAFKGSWGSQTYTKKVGVVQDLNRLSWFTAVTQLRKSSLPMPSGVKITGPRKLHASQWGYIDVLDVPEGEDIGFLKMLAIASTVTRGTSGNELIEWLYNTFTGIINISNTTMDYLAITTKIFVNGKWIGNITNPLETVVALKLYKHCGIIPIYTSIAFYTQTNEIYIYTDSGRLVRPIYYLTAGVPSFSRKGIFDLSTNWMNLVAGFGKTKIPIDLSTSISVFKPSDLYEDYSYEYLYAHRSVVEYIDVSEEDRSLIALSPNIVKNKWYTNIEIDPTLLLGVMGNCIIFPEHNPLPRNNFSGAHSRQASSIYSSNYLVRMDKSGIILQNGTSPLVRTRYLEYLNNEQVPYGVNCVVAIMVYTGYNVEDAILINGSSLKRGLFTTEYYTTYEETEDFSENPDDPLQGKIIFSEILGHQVLRTKIGLDYSKLDSNGIIREGEHVTENTILIGRINLVVSGASIDMSVKPKKGQVGIVDKVCLLTMPDGRRIAKVRIREDRVPTIGDKFASRAGQKGTIGLVIPETNMPFDSNGVRPDLIINPHAFPKRMTLGHIIESVLGKTCALNGVLGDCTAFEFSGSSLPTLFNQLQNTPLAENVSLKSSRDVYAPILQNHGYNSQGLQILYNGMTGQQIEADIFVGTNYYMRLKHMVKDKINYRAKGPVNFLTKQSVHGRANDGGLRIGEMERDSIITHGMAEFLKESFMLRGDEYKLAICNLTGLIAIYNTSTGFMLSPNIDGPLKFVSNVTTDNLLITNIIRFGRSFSIVDIPYSFKLLLQELQVMGIQIRIITDQNISKFNNLSASDNIIRLTKTTNVYNELKKHEHSINKYISEYTKMVK
jgi:DNA-directed RNA polymerase II subunit RPB2